MNFGAFISDKVCWPDLTSPSGYSTGGGFPFQISALSQLFDKTRIIILERKQPAPPRLMPLVGHNLSVHTFLEPPGKDWQRKISISAWLFFNGRRLWLEITRADALHIAVPGDLGGIAILMGLLQKKRMFIRHCGSWDQPVTWANHALLWLLETIGNNDSNIVMATGGSDQPPSARNQSITWIFSTTLESEEFQNIPLAKPWQPGETLELITVGRITAAKNAAAIIEALPEIMQIYPNVHLRIVGDGPYEKKLHQLVREKKLDNTVEFTGVLDHKGVLQMLSKSHLFIFPTGVKEGFPKAMLEAMACGLPVIATRVSIIPHLIRDCGVLLPEPNAQSVANAVISLINDISRIQTLGILAHRESQKYTLENWQGEIRSRLESAWEIFKGNLNMGLRENIAWLLWITGCLELIRITLGRNSRVVVMFHGISSRKYTNVPPDVQPYLTKDDLRSVLSWLRARYTLLTPHEFFETDKPGVLITFDDGLANNYTNALPILEEKNAPAIFFISTQHIYGLHNWLPGSRHLAQKGWGSEESVPENIAVDIYNGLSESQLRECAAHPLITIGSHTVSHPLLTHCGQDELEREIAGSKKYLEKITEKKIDLFAYPTGDYDCRVAEVVRGSGYRAAFAVDALKVTLPLFEIPRVGIYAADAPYLGLKLSGLYRRPIRASQYR